MLDNMSKDCPFHVHTDDEIIETAGDFDYHSLEDFLDKNHPRPFSLEVLFERCPNMLLGIRSFMNGSRWGRFTCCTPDMPEESHTDLVAEVF